LGKLNYELRQKEVTEDIAAASKRAQMQEQKMEQQQQQLQAQQQARAKTDLSRSLTAFKEGSVPVWRPKTTL
jgi:hypothetical protein